MTPYNHITRWKNPSNYMGKDYSDNYVVYSTTKQSGIINKSNFETLKSLLSSSVVIELNHWLCGKLWLLVIHETEKADLLKADELLRSINEDYPILNDSDFEQRESELREELSSDILLDFPDKTEEERENILDQYMGDFL